MISLISILSYNAGSLAQKPFQEPLTSLSENKDNQCAYLDKVDRRVLEEQFFDPSRLEHDMEIIKLTKDWKQYEISQVGIKFKLPESFEQYGEFRTRVEPSEKGSELCFSSSEEFPDVDIYWHSDCNRKMTRSNDEFIFVGGTVTNDFVKGVDGSFFTTVGYKDKGIKEFYLIGPGNLEYKMERSWELTSEVTNDYGVKMLTVLGQDLFYWGGPYPGTPGSDYIGVIVNLPEKDKYQGINFAMKLDEKHDLELFNQIISTFEYIK